MKSLLLFTLVLGLALAGKVAKRQTTCNCGWTNSGRIVGGKETRPNEYPWMAGVADKRGYFFCGASIISPFHVLTAAHCGSNTQVVSVAQIVIHEGWDTKNDDSDDDIAILVTSTQIQSTKTIGPVCMPTAPVQPALYNKYIKAMGWGLTTDYGRPAAFLRGVGLKVISLEVCQKAWPYNNLENKLCVAGHRKDTCNGDSGGPLVYLDPYTNKYTQAALVPFGGICGGDKPSVNTDVAAHLSWINIVIYTTKPQVKTCTASKKY